MGRRLDFLDHRRELGGNRYVYAVVSRRARGVSIGVNLNPDKACNFACPYCQVDRTVPGGPRAIDLEVLAAELDALLDRVDEGTLWRSPPFDTVPEGLRRVVDVAFSGDGEPTTAAEFPDAARLARAIRDGYRLSAPLRLLTNATMLHWGRVRAALECFDELWCKLDAGSEGHFRRVNGTAFPFGRLLSNLLALARVRPIVVQSLFFSFDGAGPEEAEIDSYVARLADLVAKGGRIDRVQVLTVARRPADPAATPLPRNALEEIAARVGALGVRAEAYP